MELKPCPFCKSRDVSNSRGQTGSGDAWQYIECETCGATASPERWNERPSEDEIQANYRYVSVLLGAAERQRDEALSMGTTVGSANPIRQVEQPAGTGHEATPKRSGNPSSSHPSIRRPTPEPQGEAVAFGYLSQFDHDVIARKMEGGWSGQCQVVIHQTPTKHRVPLYTRPQPGEGGGEEIDRTRLWDSQYVNIVNDPSVLNADDPVDAVARAVKMTEQKMAENFARYLSKGGQGG